MGETPLLCILSLYILLVWNLSPTLIWIYLCYLYIFISNHGESSKQSVYFCIEEVQAVTLKRTYDGVVVSLQLCSRVVKQFFSQVSLPCFAVHIWRECLAAVGDGKEC
jgi:hypothetical protein